MYQIVQLFLVLLHFFIVISDELAGGL